MSAMGAALVAAPDAGRGDRVGDRRHTVVVVAAVAAGVAATALSLTAPVLRGYPYLPVDTTIHGAVALAYVSAGAVAMARRPANHTGVLMVAVGLLWLVSDLGWIPAALPFTIAITFDKLYQPVLGHLALAFPSGRLPGRLERRVMTVVYAWSLVNNEILLTAYDPRSDCSNCPRNLLLVHRDDALAHTFDTVSTTVSIVLMLTVTALIVRHWIRATRAARHVMIPVVWAVGPALVYLIAVEVADLVDVGPTAARIVYDVLPLGLAVLPVGFLVGLLRTRLSYAQVRTLVPEPGALPQPGRVRVLLARALHDPTLELLYWSPAVDQYVDIDGTPRELTTAPGRAVRRLDGETGPLAAVVVDEAALDEPGVVDTTLAVARLALENERLQAEVRSQLVQLRSTTARLVGTGQAARRQIERDLHDGAQQRLLALSLTLGRARSRLDDEGGAELRTFLDDAAEDLQQAITELRELARGIHPMLLTQEGLASALRALADRAPLPVKVRAVERRFDATLEATAYFLVSEAITNAARHSGASHVTVDVSAPGDELVVRIVDDGVGGATPSGDGSGVQGMRDRVVAAGGRLMIASPAGEGTTIEARLPCA